jgi:hypothetical protein
MKRSIGPSSRAELKIAPFLLSHILGHSPLGSKFLCLYEADKLQKQIFLLEDVSAQFQQLKTRS